MAYEVIDMGIKGGLVKDIPPSSLSPDQWSTIHNLRYQDGWITPAIGYEEVFSNPPTAPIFTIGSIVNDVPTWYFAGSTKIYKNENGAYVDISRAGDYSSSTSWNGTVLNGTVFFNNGADQLQVLEAEDSIFKDSGSFPVDLKAKVFRGFKNYLFALNLTEGSQELESSLRWSDPADAGTEPPSWDIADPTTRAGQQVLADTAGYLVDALQLNDQLIIYKTDSVYSCQFIGGVFVFSFRKIFDKVGMLSERCVSSFNNQHFVVGFDDIYIHDGVQKTSVADGRIKDYFYKDLDQEYISSVFTVANYNDNEIWICYPDDHAISGSCNKALVWNWEANTWTTRDLPNVADISVGIVDPKEEDVWDTGLDHNWDDGGLHWDANRYSPANRKLFFASYENNKFYEANDSVLYDAQPFEWVLERESVHHGDPFSIKFLNSVIPEMVGSGEFSIRTGSQLQLKDGISWKAPREYTIGTFKHYARNRGRYISYRLSGNTNESQPFLQGFKLEGALGGEK